jgi:hypothetical protein
MDIAASIDKLGFRRWYERTLIEAFAYFVTCFLCMIVVAVSMEDVQILSTPTVRSMQMLLLLLGSLAIGLHSYNRFRVLLGRAEQYAAHSVCEHCDAYGVFKVVDSGTNAATQEDAPQETWMRVRCKKCSHEWRML